MTVKQVVLGFGKATLPGTFASIACFRVTAPFSRDSGVNSGRQDRSYIRDYQVGNIPNYGMLYQRRVEQPLGTVLLLQSGWKQGGIPTKDAALFLRLREGATEWHIDARLPLNQGNTHGDRFRVFEGNADILTAEDLQTYGYEVNRQYRDKFMSREEIDECFILSKATEERVQRPNLMVVGVGADKKLVEVAQAPLRRMAINRKR